MADNECLTIKSNPVAKFLKSIGKVDGGSKQKILTVSEELALYPSLANKENTKQLAANDILFWKTYGDQMPILKQMAKQYLATSGTSVASESAFSVSAYVGRKERARTDAKNLAYIVFLKDKMK
ncbi:unnamed protein product [Didymodactylos carnosus]|uniref:HAT C-terminal dimerisation domain-containing protein n=1 Tax=Didymodactylos carnosus TaxID=1234261 RepID=A0A8S2FKI3_9BILA|nr:unnamed protein product [Didymodactylos carnosus]CAF4282529.1 unnamed protein product [Didymodactylos carnosus]